MAAFFLVARDWHMAVIAVVKVGNPAVMSAITIDSAISFAYKSNKTVVFVPPNPLVTLDQLPIFDWIAVGK